MRKKMSIATIEMLGDKFGMKNIYLGSDGRVYHKPTLERLRQKEAIPAPRKAMPMPKTCGECPVSVVCNRQRCGGKYTLGCHETWRRLRRWAGKGRA